MTLLAKLHTMRDAIVRRWSDLTLAMCASDSQKFLKEVNDPFANPMGTTIRAEIERLFDALLEMLPEEEVITHLDPIIKIRSIQDAPTSEVVSFVFQLKEVLRDEFAKDWTDPHLLKQHLEFENRIDRLALLAFDRHASYQRRIADIRVREAKARVATLLRMARVDWNDLPTCTPACEQTSGGCGQ